MGTINTASARIAFAAALLLGTSAYAATIQKCQETKLKAQGKLQLCLKKNSAKVLGGAPDASTACETKFQTALTKVDNSGIAAGTTACRYLDNGDGTVSDLNTGLVWEKKGHFDGTENPGDPHDADNLYTWTAEWPPFPPNGTVFTGFLFQLNGGLSPDGTATSGCFAGHCDWRIPKIEELATVFDPTLGVCGGGSGPCMSPILGDASTSDTNSYASITGFSSGALPQQNVWTINFGATDIAFGVIGFDKRSGLVTRAVRGRPLIE
jgi:hypothetical protein